MLENLCALLFELSNEDRLRILNQLNKKAMNVTNLSKTLDLTIQESSRHISRLQEAGLTQKDIEGLHSLTPYGKVVLTQLQGLEFTSQHKNYFTSHSLEHLPVEFIYRIGELTNSTHIDGISVSVYRVEKIIREAEEHILAVTDEYLLNAALLMQEAIERGVKVKNIEARDWVPSTQIADEFYAVVGQESGEHARTSGLLEERVLERLDIYLYMSEKEVAAIAFPLPDGRFDYLGFAATDKRSHKWCRDLFQYYWDRARDRNSVVRELYRWVKKRPNAINAIKKIAAGEKLENQKELISELESRALTRQGKLTILGRYVHLRLQQ